MEGFSVVNKEINLVPPLWAPLSGSSRAFQASFVRLKCVSSRRHPSTETSLRWSVAQFGLPKSQVLRAPLSLHLALASLLIIASVVTHLYQQFLSFPARRQHFSGEAQDKHGKHQGVRARQVSQQKQSHCFNCRRKSRDSHTAWAG